MIIFVLEKPGKCLDQILNWLPENRRISGIYAFENEIQFIDQLSNCDPDLCIIRDSWDALHGLRIAEIVRQVSPKCRIIMLSETKDYALEAFDVGVQGYLLCPLEKNKFLKAVSWTGVGA